MRATVRVGAALFDLDLAAPVDLARAVRFDARPGTAPAQPFDAPAPASMTLRIAGFVGSVAAGGSCNGSTIELTPHASGTHTEGVGHLTVAALDAWRLVPAEFLPCLLLQVEPRAQGGGRVVTADSLEAAWPRAPAFDPVAVVIGSGFAATAEELRAPPCLEPEAARLLVARGIAHLVVDLPSLDPRADGGALIAHRIFFGLPTHSRELRDARRAGATVTELAAIPASLPAGSYFLSLQVPAIAGDAVPSRPLLYACARMLSGVRAPGPGS